ncbi:MULTISPECIES: ATP-binding protein [unclassified Pseudomonas]|uniref:ATP-binding protein n=2 Tax=Pseudomonas TaxID=286 RepID=UPI0007308EDC|nr:MULTISPECIES: ATP-binding protein [unclassified Pseudomonas]KSW25053.1 ATP-dependent DNA helicase [Pseudomonas sp. ADP]OBP09329.1 ATP-dependent DNA helicase [Pseudomonas sp. EGD-AKN5]QOF87629.1 putative DNA binding domain-containing protein [Pseudomonas sp. ADPe]
MSQEGQLLDKKSLRAVSGKTADWVELAKDCVAFANATGGHLLIGIEDDQNDPPASQRIPVGLSDTLRRRLAELTVNVVALPNIVTASNGGQYIDLTIPRATAVASTTDGRYFLRVADQSKPVTGDEVMRLATERNALPWEMQTTLHIQRTERDSGKCHRLLDALRASDRVKSSVKEKDDEELLDHYQLAQDQYLTHLGILCIGKQQHRAQLATAPVIQFIKYDEHGQKVNKLVWDDHTLSPMELIEAVWQEVPDFRERYELPDGLYRQNVPAFDEIVVRELLVNALVHRPYTQRGDIFRNLHPDRLEVVNPGLLPLGVTPRNILHTTVRRNEHLARLFHDLKLMEREGSGFDKMFEVLLSQGKPAPELVELHDRVQVTVRRRILKPEVIDFITKADQTYQLTQRERITLGLLAQHDALTARELAQALELPSVESLPPWLKRPLEWQLVRSSGRTQAMRYFIDPQLLRSLDFSTSTTLKRIEPHRLAALVLEDLQRYPESAISDIHQRVGAEIHPKQVKRALDELIERGEARFEGNNRWRRYWAVS